MAKAVKKTAEVAIIDFTKFDIQQLPEFIGKKEEIKAVIKANPIVEITDNATYESAKKSRTAVKTTRTGLEKEKKDVADRIKNNVLGVVNTEYDKLIEDVKKEEAIRQEKVTAWEDKKEEERKEKARLEQERIDGIKNSISEFRKNWDDVVFTLTFDKIEDVREDYSVAVLEFDRSKLAEFEILFDDAVVYLDNLFANKEKTLREQEQIRLDNIVLEEKKSEMAKISAFEKSWNANIDTLKFEDISSDLKNSLEKSKLADLKHYQDEFNDKYTSIENRLNAQIEFVSKQESQRLAEEKLEKEKAEFEKTQAEAKFQERRKFLVDEEYWGIYLLAECGEEEDVAKGKLLNFTDLEFEDFKLAVFKAKEPINPFQEVEFEEDPAIALEHIDPKDTLPLGTTDKIDEIANNDAFIQVNDQEDDVHEVATAPLFNIKITNDQIDDYAWNLIHEEWERTTNMEGQDFFDFLKNNFNSPTRKEKE